MLLVSSMFPPRFAVLLSRLHSATLRLRLDLHLLQVFVGGVLVAVVLHLAEVALLRCQHGVDLRDRHRAVDLNRRRRR